MTVGPNGNPAAHLPHSPGRARRTAQWTKGRKALFGAIGFGSIAIAGAGFTGSYSAVHALAVRKGFGQFASVFPLAVDLGIAVLLALDLALTWVELRYPLLRYMAWLLTAATITFNAASSWPDALGSAMHAVIPLLFIAVTEAMRNAIATAADIEAARSIDSIRLTRWLLSPATTFSIWRDMRLWEIASYPVALGQYQNRMLLRQELRSEYGRRWRSRAPAERLRPLRQARLGVAVRRSEVSGAVRTSEIAAGSEAVEAVEAARAAEVTRAVDLPHAVEVPQPADVLQRADVPEAVDVPQAAEVPPAADVPRIVQPAQPAQPAPFGPGDEDDEVADQDRPGPSIDLGPAPHGETKSQRAERIYRAHHEAGVPLTRPELARWAGYMQEGSGRTQYNKLEKKFGPIIARQAADDADDAWDLTPEQQSVGR